MPDPLAPHAAEMAAQQRQPADERQVVEFHPPHALAGASGATQALPGPAVRRASDPQSGGDGQQPESQMPPGAAAGAALGASRGTAPDPALRPQSRTLAESLQAAAAARQREASLAAPAPTAAAEGALPAAAPREASTVVITEVPPSPQQPTLQGTQAAAPRQQTECRGAQRNSRAQGGAVAINKDASARAEPMHGDASQELNAAAADTSAEPPAKLSQAKPAVAGEGAPELATADFEHLPPHLRPKYAAAALRQTAEQDEPSSRPGVANSGRGTAAAGTPLAEAANGASAVPSVKAHLICCVLAALTLEGTHQ